MAKQLNVNLAFTADTGKARQQLQELQQTLKNLSNNTAQNSPLGITKEINQAIGDVAKLRVALNNAISSSTGKLDLGQFRQELSKAGFSAQTIAQQLSMLGPEGKQAFAQLSQAITTAEIPLKRTSALLDNFATTLKNTARWQISSSLLHGFIGSIQSAYYYAEDLNKSLNNIRVVTGYDTEQMAEFAEQANEAAKALNTTTTQYTDAALIYYQQGLTGDAVTERVDTTVKLANVTRQAAEDVSQQMTAIWNNFDDGSQSLEHYADVITALGATTASSSAEIAEGLQKFAAVADTVGLSYDYATAALATVTATTRQSADIVGNAFKTLFSRLEGLKLGETLDDGTDLNKYSQALDAVGISIKDASGQLKAMDNILDELGGKWKNLAEDEKMALAQTVGGVRQYTQLIALMENYDFFKQNVATAQGAEGSLQKQADIYAESWEAAQKKVKASLESIYDELVDDKFFTNLSNTFSELIDGINGIIKALGGLKGVLPLIGTLLLKIFSTDLSNSIDKLIYNIKLSTESGRQAIIEERKKFNNELIQLQEEEGSILGGGASDIYRQQGEVQNLLIDKTIQLAASQKQITEEEQKQLGLLMDISNQTGTEYQETLKNVEALEAEADQLKSQINLRASKVENYTQSQLKEELKDIENLQKTYSQVFTLKEKYFRSSNKGLNEKELQDTLKNIKEQLNNISPEAGKANKEITELWESFNKLSTASPKELDQAFVELEEKLNAVGATSLESFEKIIDGIKGTDASSKELENQLQQLLKIFSALGQKQSEAAEASNNYNQVIEKLKERINELKGTQISLSQGIVAATQALSSFGMFLSSSKSVIETFNNESTSMGDKIVSIITSLGFMAGALHSVKAGYTKLLTAISAYNTSLVKLKVTQDGLNVSLLASPITWLIGGITALITVLTVLDSIQKEIRKNNIEEAQEELKKIQAYQKEVEAHQELVNSYKELINQQQKGEDVSQSLTAKMLELADAYDIVNGKLLAVTGNTEVFNQKLKEARQKELEENIKQAREGTNKAVIEGINAGKGTSSSGNYTFKAGEGKVFLDTKENAFDIAKLEKILKDNNLNATSDKINDGLVKAITVKVAFDTKNPKEFLEYIDKIDNAIKGLESEYGSDVKEKAGDIYIKLKEEQKALSDSAKDLREQFDEISANSIELEFLNFDLNSNTSAKDLNKYINQVKENLKDSIPQDYLDKYLDKYLSGIKEISTAYNQIDIAKQISDKTEEDFDNVLELIKKYDDSGLATISIHLDTLDASTQLKQWLDSQGIILSSSIEKGVSLGFENALKNFDENKGFSETDIENLFSNKEIKSRIGISKEDFKASEASAQLSIITNAWINAQKAVVNYKDEVNKALELEKENTSKQIAEKEEEYHQAANAIKQILSPLQDYQDKYKELNDIILNYAKNEKQITQAEKTKLELFIQENKIDKDTLINNAKKVNEYKKLQSSFEKLENAIEDNKNATENYLQISEALDQQLSIQNKEMDNIQNNYKTLTSIVEDYNKTGAWTIDNVQQLINMDREYVATLQFENGQLTINEQAFQTMTLAKIDDLEQTVLLKMQEDLLALAQEHAAETASANAAQQQFQAAMVREGIAAARKGAEAWREFAAAQAAAAGVSDAAYQEKVKTITDSTFNQLQALENARKNVSAGGASFNRAMGAGSGSGSGSKAKEKEVKEYKEDESDRYWDLNNAIKAVENSFKRLEAVQKRVESRQSHYYGKALIESLKNENELIEEQNKLIAKQKKNYEALEKEQFKELGELKGALISLGGSFDKDRLTNYFSVMQQGLADYNSAVDAYNASAQEDADKKALESAEKTYSNLKDTLGKYQDLYYNKLSETKSKLEELTQEELENYYKLLENNLKAWEIEIELKLELTEAKRKWNEFLKQVEKDFRKVFQDLTIESGFGKDNFTTYAEDINTTLTAIKDVELEIDRIQAGGASDKFDNISEAQEKLKELQDQLIDQGKSLNDVYQELWDNYINGINQVNDKFDDLMKKYQRLDDELEYEKELIELIYGDEAYELINKFYNAQQANTLAQIDSLRQQATFWENEFNKSYQMNKDRVNLDDITTWTEDMKQAYEQMNTAQQSLNDKIIEGVKLLQDKYLVTIKQITTEMDKAIWGMKLDQVKADWDFIQKRASEYLDDVEGAYRVQTLANKITKSIAEASSLTAQQKLQALRESEITMLREKEHLTQSDIDLAEARYQIALKEIALQDAQNNKTSMKLTRDTSGNWTYQYVADEEDVRNKQQELLDAYNNLYEMADQAYNHAMELAMNTYEEMQNRIREIAEDMTLSEEEKMQKIQEIYDMYLPLIDAAFENSELYKQEAMTATGAVFLEIVEQDKEAFQSLTDLQKELLDQIRDKHLEDYEAIRSAVVDEVYPAIRESAQQTFEQFNENSKTQVENTKNNWIQNPDSIKNTVEQAYKDITAAGEAYRISLEDLQNKAGQYFNKIGQSIDNVRSKTEQLDDKTRQLTNDSATYLDILRQYVDSVAMSWVNVIGMIQQAKAELEAYLALQTAIVREQFREEESDTPATGAGSGQGGYASGNSGSGNLGGSGSGNRGPIYDSKGHRLYEGEENKLSDYEYNELLKRAYGEGSYRSSKIIHGGGGGSFATGGYTGSWDDTGRLAVLHQKELVLNADDTANMLQAVSAVRDLAKLNDSINSAIASSIGAMAMNIVANSGNGINPVNNSNTDNQYYITAEFPNANDVNSIREAILSLPNLASQYIHSNN